MDTLDRTGAAAESGHLTLSAAQERMWFIDQLDPGSASYHMYTAHRLRGRLDEAALVGAIDGIVARHAPLRTCFPVVDGRPVRHVRPRLRIRLERLDLAGGTDPVARAHELVDERMRLPFDLGADALVRATLMRLGPDDHVLLLVLHHIVCDGASIGPLFAELTALYGGQPLPDLPETEAEPDVPWRPDRESTVDFWRERLSGVPPLELPTDRPRPPVPDAAHGGTVEFRVPPTLADELADFARRQRCTPFMVLMAAFQAVLGRYCGQSDFCVGTVLAGRDRVELEPLIGLFTNTLVLRADLSGEPTFLDLLRRVRRSAIDAYSNPDIPFERLPAQRDPARSPFFDTMLILQPAPETSFALAGLSTEDFEVELPGAKIDLTLELCPDAEGMHALVTYRMDLFERDTVEAFAGLFAAVLAEAVRRPDTPLPDLFPAPDPVSDAGPAAGAGDDPDGGPDGADVLALLAGAPPDGTAVVDGGRRLTHAQLHARANRLAHELRGRGAGPGAIVAVCLDRSTDLIVALLAVLKAGAAYLPMDPQYPPARLAMMLADSGAALLVTRGEPSVHTGQSTVDLDRDRAAIDARPATDPGVPVDPDSLAYLIYTSGSTGRPKGVAVPHRALAARVRWMRGHYRLTPADRVLQFASVSFDTHAEEVYPCLAAGAALVLAPTGAGLEDFLGTPEGAALTVLDLPTPYWHELVADLDAVPWPPALRLLILGADQVRAQALARWRAAFDDRVRVLNTYGPTETTIIATCADLTRADAGRRPPIGHLLPGTRGYVLDAAGRPVPVGAAGELCLAGDGLARGYLHRPQLTARRFVPDPFGPPGGRMYRTGDRVRRRVDGQLEFLGRLDDQVKVRGYRIELGEVEAALGRHPAVRQAAVLARPDGTGANRLVAYLVGEDGADVRAHLTAELPAHMLPGAYVWVPRLPLTVNGKLDVAALPDPSAARPARSPAPGAAERTITEELVCAVWSDVLGVPVVGAGDDFFDLGGHSLLATRVRARLREALRVEVPLRALFTHRTARALASLVDGLLRDGGGTQARPVTPRPAGTAPLPLSYDQERLWFLAQLDPADASYNIPLAVRLTGPLDSDRLESALNTIVARHESLRTRFPAVDGRPHQEVVADSPVRLARVDASADRAAGDTRLAEDCNQPFDLATGPLVRAALVRFGPGDHVLGLVVHHIAMDGWSMSVLLHELSCLYSGQPLPPLPVQYADFALWQREQHDGPAQDALVAHWRERLAGAPVLDLPTDRPRPAVRTTSGAMLRRVLPARLADALRERARAEQCTLFMALLTAYEVVLGRHGGQDDFLVGAPIAGRDRVELEPLIGYFVNTIVLRADLTGDPTLRDLLHRTRTGALDAYAHQYLPFERLMTELRVARDPSRTGLFQTAFALQNANTHGLSVDDLAVEPYQVEYRQSKFDLALDVWDAGSGMTLVFTYNTDLFDAERIHRLGGHLERVLGVLAEAPGTRLSGVDLLEDAERSLITRGFNDTAAPFPDRDTLVSQVEAQATRTPDAVALRCAGAALSYLELDRRANHVAHRLRTAGVGRGDVVGVCLPRGLDLPVALLGVLKAGAAYLPLDPDYPAARRDFMLADSGARLVLEGALEPGGADAPPGDPPGPRDAAYLIYTSGSTGRPKGVLVDHRAIVNRLDWMQRAHRLGPDDVVLHKTPTAFDVSVWELFWPLVTGAVMELAQPGGHRDAGYLRDLVVHGGVTTLHFVPSMLAAFLAEPGVERCGTLRRVVCSGEALSPALTQRCLATLPHAQLHNLYGPTEAAVDVTAWQCRPGEATVPIGYPVQNTRLYVLDAAMRPVPVGVPGELYIGGVQVARGYHNRPALTAQRFVADPFGPPGARLYRTGDRACWRPDGALEYLGRLDRQVKLRGQRIELGEIEAVLREQPGVRDAAVLLREDRPGDQRVVGYLVGGDPPAVQAGLRRTLPEYLVPSALVPLDALPLTPNGKVDRAALPAPKAASGGRAGSAPPRTPAQLLVARVFQEVLGARRVGADDDFFELGGHSLLATQVVARLRGAGPGGVSVLDVFRHRTVRALADLLDAPEDRPRELLNLLTPAGREARRSLVCVPYGGGSAVVYQPLADALPDDHALWSVAIPGHDIGLDEDRLPLDELAARCVREVLAKVPGPIVLYGHCGVGGVLIMEIARRLEEAGRELDAVFVGAIFPFARPGSRLLTGLSRLARLEFLRSDQGYANWLTSVGVDMAGLDPAVARRIIRNMRRDSEAAEEHFTALFAAGVHRLRAPVVTVAGTRDPATDYYQERYREWHLLADRSALVVLEEAGHFFLRYRAAELAQIVAAAQDEASVGPDYAHPGWCLRAVSTSPTPVRPAGPQPGMARFLAVAAGQLVSITGSALTEFAIPIWIYLTTGSLARFALFAVVGLVPGMLVAPLAGAIVDQVSRRAVMIAGDCAAGGTQLALGALLWTHHLHVWEIYPLLACLSLALTFQRLAYGSAVPQLVPKRYLGHANGVVQLAGGMAQLVVPLVAVGLMAAIGLGGILLIDVVSYAVAVAVVAAVRFPRTMPWRRREPLLTEVAEGLRYSWGNRSFRAMLLWFAGLNIFLAPLFLMVTPLVLGFGTLGQVGRVAFVSGAGAVAGALVLAVWGGPRRRRMRGMLLCTLALAASCVVAGLRPSLAAVAAGACGMALWLTLVNGVYTTIVQVKVPQRFHGRVFALNTVIAWSTLPVGFAVIGPYGSRLFEAPARHLAPLVGSGTGRGIGLMYVVFGLAIAGFVAAATGVRALARFDDEVPDARPDDLVGAEVLARRAGAAHPGPAGPRRPGGPGRRPDRQPEPATGPDARQSSSNDAEAASRAGVG
jgi:amino acid adenylation domain-containing protein